MNFQLYDTNAGQPKVTNVTTADLVVVYILLYPCSSSTSCTPYTTTLQPGKYKFEVFGAGGGDYESTPNTGGKGGVSTGYYINNVSTTAYFFIGGKGVGSSKGGCNGGGSGGYDSNNPIGSGGGGSSDIRIGLNSKEKRIIVAGAGGGGCYSAKGGDAGGLTGSDGTTNIYGQGGTGGNQESGGTVYSGSGATNGDLGLGGQGSSNPQAWGSGGGGSGYYGGAGGSSTLTHNEGGGYCGGGGGGSGYIGGVWSSPEYDIVAETKPGTNMGNGYIIISFYGFLSPKKKLCNTMKNICELRSNLYYYLSCLIMIDAS